MAKDNNTSTSMDEIDSILAGLEADDGLNFEKMPSDERDAAKGVAKNIRDGFLDSFKNNPKDKLVKFVDEALPKSINREIDFLKSTTSDALKVYNKSANEIKSGVKSTVDIIKSKISQDSSLHKLLNNISGKLEKEESFNRGSDKPSDDDVIADTLKDLFAKNRKIDEITDKVRDIKENKKFELNLFNSNKLISTVEKIHNFHQQYTLNYYKKSIELKLKTLFVNKELLEVTKSASEASIRQFEAIIHNTSLPDLTKLRNSEQFTETIKGRMRENMADMFLPAMRPLDVLRKGIANKIEDTMGKISTGLSMGINSYEMMSMTGGIASGVGGMAGDQLQSMVANMVSQKLEDMPFVKRALKKTKLFMADPSDTFLDLAEKAESKNTVMSRFASKRLRDLGFMAQTKSVENKRFVEGHPDDVTLFDYKTKNSIVKIIPSILGKIYGEVKSIRTGTDPVKIYYDYSTGKLEESTSFGSRIEGKVKLALDTNVQGEVNKFLSIIDKDGEMSNSTNNNIMAALIDHLSRGGAISPKSLLKDDFLNKLGKKDRKMFSEKLGKVIDPNNDEVDAMTVGDLSDILYSVKTNTPHIDSLIKEFYTNGQIEEVEAMGLVDYDPVTGAYTVNKDKYGEIIKKIITKSKGKYSTASKGATIDVSKNDVMEEIKNSSTYKNAMFRVKKMRDRVNKILGNNTNYANLPVLYTPTDSDNKKKPLKTDDVIHMGYNKNATSASREIAVRGTRDVIKHTIYLKEVLSQDKVDAVLMHKAYIESGVHLSYVTMNEWAKSIGYTKKGDSYEKSPEDDTLNQAKKTVLQHILGYFKSFTGYAGKFSGISKLFDLEPNMTPLMVMHKVIKKTREWDTKIVNALPKAMWKTVKGAWNLTKTIGKGGIKGLFSRNTYNLLRVLWGNAPVYEDGENGSLGKVHETIKKTRGWDKSFVTGTPGTIWGAMKKAKEKWDSTGSMGLGKKLWNTGRVLWGMEPEQEAKVASSENLGEVAKKKTFKERLKAIIDSINIPEDVKSKVMAAMSSSNFKEAAKLLEPYGIDVRDIISKASKKYSSYKEKASEKFEDLKETVKEKMQEHDVSGKFSNFKSKLQGWLDDAKTKLPDNVKEKVNELISKGNIKEAENLLSKYGIDINDIIGKSTNKFNDIKNEATNLKGKINRETINGLASAIKDAFLKSGVFKAFKSDSKDKVFGDSDGDGDRDNSWMDRLSSKVVTNKDEENLKALGSKKSKGVWGFLKDKIMWIGGLLAAGLSKLGLLKHLTKIVPLLGGIASIVKGGWGVAKTVGTGAVVAGKAIWSAGSAAASFIGGSMAATKLSTSKALVSTGAAASKATGKGVLSMLSTFKSQIVKKFGSKGGAKLLAMLAAKIAARAVPIAGTAILAYDAACIAADMLKNGTDFKSAVSKQILGTDIFNPDEVAYDENGNPIKPDETEVPTEIKEVDPNLDFYVRELLRIAKKELEFGVKDEEARAKLQEFKDKHKLKDEDIIKHYNNVRIMELTKEKSSKKSTAEELDSLKKEIQDRVEKTRLENEKGQSGGYQDSAYESGAGNGGAITQDLAQKAAQQRLKNRDAALIEGWNGYGDSVTNSTGTIEIKGQEDILKMLDEVAVKTGVDGNLLKNFAAIESGFKTKVKSNTSSATGLFQFVTDTWNDMLKKYGAKYGLGMDAKREDPWANSLMGAEYVKENKARLSRIGRGNNLADLYLAHFLGGGGTEKFFKSPVSGLVTAWADAKSLAANKTIFYKNGRPITNAELYKWAENKVKNTLSGFGLKTTGNNSSTPIVKDTTPAVTVSTESPDVNKYTPSAQGNTVTTTDAVDKASGFTPAHTNKVSMTTEPTPVVTTTSSSSLDQGYGSDVLKDSLQVQIKMENHLRSIYEYLVSKSSGMPSPKEVTSNATIAMPESVIDLNKKRF